MLERGERLPRVDTLIKLMGALEVPAGDLLDGIEWVADGRFGSEPPGESRQENC